MSGVERVEFEGVSHFYEPGTDIKVKIKRTPDGCERRSDWVGIFPVGWKSLKEFVTFGYVKQMEFVVFFSASLPFSDSDSFYQFVYVSADSRVLTTSIPFQFQMPYDDLSLLPDPDDDGEAVVMVKRKQNWETDYLAVRESASNNEVHPLFESSQTVNERTASAPPSGLFSKRESIESVKRERDEYMKQFHNERKVTEMQEEKYLALENKLDAVVAENQILNDENKALRLGNLKLNDEVRAAQRDNVVLEKEVKRLGGIVANLSKQNRHQSEEALACQPRKVQLGEKEDVSLLSGVHITRPPPYRPPQDDISNLLNRSDVSSTHSGDKVEQAVSGSPNENCFECPMCEKKLPKSIGSAAFQMHVNLHFH